MVWYAALKLRFRVYIPIYLLIIETRLIRYVLYSSFKIGFVIVIEIKSQYCLYKRERLN